MQPRVTLGRDAIKALMKAGWTQVKSFGNGGVTEVSATPQSIAEWKELVAEAEREEQALEARRVSASV